MRNAKSGRKTWDMRHEETSFFVGAGPRACPSIEKTGGFAERFCAIRNPLSAIRILNKNELRTALNGMNQEIENRHETQ